MSLFAFSVFWINNTILCEKWSIKDYVPGFDPTTSWSAVSSYNHTIRVHREMLFYGRVNSTQFLTQKEIRNKLVQGSLPSWCSSVDAWVKKSETILFKFERTFFADSVTSIILDSSKTSAATLTVFINFENLTWLLLRFGLIGDILWFVLLKRNKNQWNSNSKIRVSVALHKELLLLAPC